MIGEIRDRDTAQIAVESALTGHLVLSTLHTNDAPGALSRLTEMGIEPFLTASAVDCVLAQRLARKLCEHCREPFKPTQEMLRRNDFPPEACEDWENVTLYRAGGVRQMQQHRIQRPVWACTRSCWSPKPSKDSRSSAKAPMR